MPNCRRPVVTFAHFPEPPPVRLSRYLVRRRVPLKAMNDNRRPARFIAWQWVLAFAPTLTAALLLSGFF